MPKFFNKFEKPFPDKFWSIFSILGISFSSETPALSYTTSYGFLASGQNLEKPNDAIPRKRLKRQKGR